MAKVDRVPVRHAPVLRRILAHGRDHDAVGELQVSDLERGEQLGHDNLYFAGTGWGWRTASMRSW